MKKTPSRELKDIIQDYLEISSKLAENERTYLVHKLAKEPVGSNAIEVRPAFSVDGKIIVVGNEKVSECWLYAPKVKKIKKIRWPQD